MLYRDCILLFLQNDTCIFPMYFSNKIVLTKDFNEITYLISKCYLIMIKNRCFGTFHVN